MSKVSLVVSDVDGTLVTNDKVLTAPSRAAVARLGAAGIGFSIVSSRPPFGLRMLVEPLALRLPMGAYNGGTLVNPDESVIEQRLLPHATAQMALAVFRACGVHVWLFAGARWMTDATDGPYIGKEVQAIRTEPTPVTRLEDHLDGVAKMVGVSDDFARLTACEPLAREALAGSATVARSQAYYLDVTPAGTDKGVAVEAIARRLGIVPAEIVTIGDMENDVAMFRRSGFSIAMGNADAAVRRAADAATLTNEENGFAAAVERMILPRARS